jgi:hemolysin D
MAPGRLIVSERTKIVQPLEAAVVTAIHVHDGDRVEAGQLLIELDPTAPQADAVSVEEQRRNAEAERLRTEVLLHETAQAEPSQSATTERPNRAAQRARVQDAQLEAEQRDIQAKLARMDADIHRREAELATASAQRAKLQVTLPLAQQRERDIQGLSDQGFIAQHAGQDRVRERLELERDLVTAEARVAETKAGLVEGHQARTAYLAETRRSLQERATKARLELGQLGQAGRKAAQRSSQTRLTAPVAGTVQQLAVNTTGGVVTPAQILMVIVPKDALLVAEVQIDNKDIGFVRAGQTAQIKLETFNFIKYGTIPATLQWVAADATSAGQRNDTTAMQTQGANAAQPSRTVFPAKLQLTGKEIFIDGKSIKLGAGLNVTAEIKTGRRRVVEYLLSPIQQHLADSFSER